MTSDRFISGFGNRGESWSVIVTPRQPFSRRPIAQRAIDGFRGEKSFAVWLNQSDCAPELFDWNFGEPMSRLLIGRVIDHTFRDLSPALDPLFAKMTFAVPDRERFRRRIGNADVH